ncbi:hypothetical protein FIBSPDRAFT_238032 [Athelia psychrophila]|uniref:Uncharacterized protein n=1 Tax=Athelia psychrophila TaxID=1759441 RepID=A0A166S324_9AGAM|nr:hypothetical protein FIBSPDRAFT_238032 [Fibularhizoctonia sp. CBS 109695]
MRVLGSLIPTPGIPWMRVAGALGTVHDMLLGDAERIEMLMAELDLGSDAEEEEPVDMEAAGQQSSTTRSAVPLVMGATGQRNKREREFPLPRRPHGNTPHKKRRRATKQLDHPLLIPSTHPSAPSILITPCPTARASSSWVPLQDAAFGSVLCVPSYPAFNAPLSYPPFKPDNLCSRSPMIEKWKWRDGHWRAVLPDVETQVRRGWFARPVSMKRKSTRPRSN